jgi:hypothetical protein
MSAWGSIDVWLTQCLALALLRRSEGRVRLRAGRRRQPLRLAKGHIPGRVYRRRLGGHLWDQDVVRRLLWKVLQAHVDGQGAVRDLRSRRSLGPIHHGHGDELVSLQWKREVVSERRVGAMKPSMELRNVRGRR